MKKPKSGFILLKNFPIKKDANLDSLIGHAFGDGHVDDNFEYTNKCEELLDEVNHSVEKLSIKGVRVINNSQPNKAPTLVFPKIVDLVENKPLTIDEIAGHIGFGWKATWEHLTELESNNFVIRLKLDSSRKSLWYKNNEKHYLQIK